MLEIIMFSISVGISIWLFFNLIFSGEENFFLYYNEKFHELKNEEKKAIKDKFISKDMKEKYNMEVYLNLLMFVLSIVVVVYSYIGYFHFSIVSVIFLIISYMLNKSLLNILIENIKNNEELYKKYIKKYETGEKQFLNSIIIILIIFGGFLIFVFSQEIEKEKIMEKTEKYEKKYLDDTKVYLYKSNMNSIEEKKKIFSEIKNSLKKCNKEFYCYVSDNTRSMYFVDKGIFNHADCLEKEPSIKKLEIIIKEEERIEQDIIDLKFKENSVCDKDNN